MSQDKTQQVEALLSRLDGSGAKTEYQAIRELENVYGDRLPAILSQQYDESNKWQQRCSLLFFSIGRARNSQEAVDLGIKALQDKSKKVRYRACMLLAWSLSKDALAPLQQALKVDHDKETLENILAAIDAIKNQNSNYFVDREHTGKVKLNIAQVT